MESVSSAGDGSEIATSDATPSSSTDAGVSSVSVQVLDDPISSSTKRASSVDDTDDELLVEMNMATRQSCANITENVDDLMNDLETLLGESSDSVGNLDESSSKDVGILKEKDEGPSKDPHTSGSEVSSEVSPLKESQEIPGIVEEITTGTDELNNFEDTQPNKEATVENADESSNEPIVLQLEPSDDGEDSEGSDQNEQEKEKSVEIIENESINDSKHPETVEKGPVNKPDKYDTAESNTVSDNEKEVTTETSVKTEEVTENIEATGHGKDVAVPESQPDTKDVEVPELSGVVTKVAAVSESTQSTSVELEAEAEEKEESTLQDIIKMSSEPNEYLNKVEKRVEERDREVTASIQKVSEEKIPASIEEISKHGNDNEQKDVVQQIFQSCDHPIQDDVTQEISTSEDQQKHEVIIQDVNEVSDTSQSKQETEKSEITQSDDDLELTESDNAFKLKAEELDKSGQKPQEATITQSDTCTEDDLAVQALAETSPNREVDKDESAIRGINEVYEQKDEELTVSKIPDTSKNAHIEQKDMGAVVQEMGAVQDMVDNSSAFDQESRQNEKSQTEFIQERNLDIQAQLLRSRSQEEEAVLAIIPRDPEHTVGAFIEEKNPISESDVLVIAPNTNIDENKAEPEPEINIEPVIQETLPVTNEQAVPDKESNVPKDQIIVPKESFSPKPETEVIKPNVKESTKQKVFDGEEQDKVAQSTKAHSQPLTIAVEEEKEVAPKVTHKAQIPEGDNGKGCLKMTITKHSDKMHSILKVYDPDEKPSAGQVEEVHEEPIPKLLIKSKQQASPKTSTKKCHSPPASISAPDPNIRVTRKSVAKSEDPTKKSSPKLNVKEESEPKHASPRITIKPIAHPAADIADDSAAPTPPKLTIKLTKRPLAEEDQPDEDSPLKKTTRSATKATEEEENAPTHSPKITIKPIKKSDCEESHSSPRSKSDDHEEVRIVLKINKGAVSSKGTKKRDSQPPHEEEKLAKIKLKFSMGGGHAHIVSPTETAEKTDDSITPECVEVQKLTQGESSNHSKEIKKKEEPVKVEQPYPMDTTPAKVPTPTPKRRGRPRKNPLIPREESKEIPTYSSPKLDETMSPTPSSAPSPAPSVESSTPSIRSISRESTPTATPVSEGRPKRSCRGQNVIATLGIKPRKPRGGGRGGRVNMGDRVSATPEKNITKNLSQSLDSSQTSESVKTPDIEPPKRGRGRRRKVSDPHKDTASDTSSIISEVICLEDDEEPKNKISKEEEASVKTAEENREKKELEEREIFKQQRRERLTKQLEKARLARQETIQKKKKRGRKQDEGEEKSEKTIVTKTADNSTLVDDASSMSIQTDHSKTVHGAISLPFTPTKIEVIEKDVVVPSPASSPEKPKQTTRMDVSSCLPESLVDEETRMSADQGFREAVSTKQVLNSEAGAEDSQSSMQSTGTTESGKTGNSGKNSRTRMEVHHELDSNVVTVEQLAEYYWDNGGPFMLQEQVSLYLRITSFKRKYPNIVRRAVDMQERDYLRENGLATEAMCNLGLTAVSSHDIIDIMFKDFQDKYEEYCRYTQEKQAKELMNKQKVLSQIQKNFDKTELMEQAIQSTLQWNREFNKARKEHRQASMDLQTFTVQYPKGRVRQIKKPNVGSYPVALVPGQFTDYYKDLTAMEINNLPLNSLGTGFFESSDLDSGSSDDDSDSSSTSSSSDYSSDEDCKLCAKHTLPVKANNN